MPNFTEALPGAVAITSDNQRLIESDYNARTEAELPVLERWIPLEAVTLTKAKYLDIILYSREQIQKENAAMGQQTDETAAWGIVSVKPQDVAIELPMTPMTMMRNALGKEEGGSGVPLDRAKYMASAAYWKANVAVKNSNN